MKKVSSWAGVLLASVLGAFAVMPAAPAQAADAVTPFVLTYGNSKLEGKLEWNQRSVTFSGYQTVASGSGCRRAEFRASNGMVFDWGYTSQRCVAGKWPFQGTLTVDKPGGPSYVDIMWYGAATQDAEWNSIGQLHCTRTGCSY
jgi:hypothetical protein